VVDGEQPDGALTPLADAVEKTIEPPYRAAAARSDGAVWSVIAESVVIVELPGVHGEVADLTVLGGMRELTVDGAPASSSTPSQTSTATRPCTQSASTATSSRSTSSPCSSPHVRRLSLWATCSGSCRSAASARSART